MKIYLWISTNKIISDDIYSSKQREEQGIRAWKAGKPRDNFQLKIDLRHISIFQITLTYFMVLIFTCGTISGKMFLAQLQTTRSFI